MKIGSLLFCILSVVGCSGAEPASLEQALINGSEDSGDPMVVALIAYPKGQYEKRAICTGSLISPRVILTAGHCVHPLFFADEPQNMVFEAYIGQDVSYSSPSERLPVAEVHPHPEFEPARKDKGFDVGVAILAQPVPPMAPFLTVNRAPLTSAVGQEVRWVGFGRFTTDGTSGRKRQSPAKIVEFDPASSSACPNTDCSRIQSAAYRIHNDNAHVCSGDSGGPTFVQQNGAEVIAAVASWADSCGSPSYHSRVDTVLPFIDEMIASTNGTGPTGGCSLAAPVAPSTNVAGVALILLVFTTCVVAKRLKKNFSP